MLNNRYIVVLIIIIAFSPIELGAQKWKKSLKNIGKKVAKEVVKEIKPLSVNFKVSNINYNPFKSINKLTLTIDFDCVNPNALGVTFNRTELELLVNEKLVSKFYNEKKISIPKKDKFTYIIVSISANLINIWAICLSENPFTPECYKTPTPTRRTCCCSHQIFLVLVLTKSSFVVFFQ